SNRFPSLPASTCSTSSFTSRFPHSSHLVLSSPMAAAQPQRVSTRATGVVGVAVMCSRVLGLIREHVFAGLFGAGKNLDAFLMAFRLANLLRDLFAEAALSTAFITTFSR